MYNRLFTKILDSSIWLEPHATRIVWVTLLAAMDEDGIAHFSALENLSNRARVTLAEAEKAVECFLAPDKNSGDPDNDGRRLERIPGGFIILNASKYRSLFKREIQREQTRLRVERHREAQKRYITNSNDNDVTLCNDLKRSVTQSVAVSVALADTKEEEKKKHAPRFAPPSLEEIKLQAAKIGLAPIEADKFHAHYETNGWRTNAGPVKSWTACLTKWKLNQQNWSKNGTGNKNHGPNPAVNPASERRNAGTINPVTDIGEAFRKKQQRQTEAREKEEVARQLHST